MSHSDPRPNSLVLGPLKVPTYPLTARLASSAIAACVSLHMAEGVDNRADLARATSLSRTTVGTGVEFLARRGLLDISSVNAANGRGRPSDHLRFTAKVGLIAVADLGITSSNLSVFTADQTCLAYELALVDLAQGPETAVPALIDHLRSLVKTVDPGLGKIEICVVAVPGPVDGRRLGVTRPPLLPGWESYSLTDAFEQYFDCPVLIDKDVNLRALGESLALPDNQRPLFLVKIASALEAGLILPDGSIYRGADGSAGNLGHIATPSADDNPCTCGNTGCLETIASTTAFVSRLSKITGVNTDLSDFERLLRAADPTAVQILREGIRALGQVLAGLVSFTHPARIVLSGAIIGWNPDILSGVRSVIYQRALPSATTRLTVAPAAYGDWSGSAGALMVGLEALLNEQRLLAISQ